MSTFLETREGRRARMRAAPEAVDFLADNHDSWRIVSGRSGGGGDRCGLTAHRGVLHPDEHVDRARLVAMVEAELGHTVAELRSVYRQGRLSAEHRELRGRIDARLLALSRSGGNMTLLGRILGFCVNDGGCDVIYNALARARQRKEEA